MKSMSYFSVILGFAPCLEATSAPIAHARSRLSSGLRFVNIPFSRVAKKESPAPTVSATSMGNPFCV
tara:strand:+ start:439 stop:639 length:201 start_codon:yes stop_codon:yes gene_type:complete